MNNDDVIFLSLMNEQLSGLLQRFHQAASMPVSLRIPWARQQLDHVYRDGWFVNTPVGKRGDGETVSVHVNHLKQLIERYFPATLHDIGKKYAEWHDLQESIASVIIEGVRRDLNPRFNKDSYSLSDEDKERLEMMVIKLLLESNKEALGIWMSYKNEETEAAICFKGLDKVCVMWRCVGFVQSGAYEFDDFQAYWDYWSLEQAKKKLPPLVSDIYEQQLWPQIEALRPQ